MPERSRKGPRDLNQCRPHVRPGHYHLRWMERQPDQRKQLLLDLIGPLRAQHHRRSQQLSEQARYRPIADRCEQHNTPPSARGSIADERLRARVAARAVCSVGAGRAVGAPRLVSAPKRLGAGSVLGESQRAVGPLTGADRNLRGLTGPLSLVDAVRRDRVLGVGSLARGIGTVGLGLGGWLSGAQRDVTAYSSARSYTVGADLHALRTGIFAARVRGGMASDYARGLGSAAAAGVLGTRAFAQLSRMAGGPQGFLAGVERAGGLASGRLFREQASALGARGFLDGVGRASALASGRLFTELSATGVFGINSRGSLASVYLPAGASRFLGAAAALDSRHLSVLATGIGAHRFARRGAGGWLDARPATALARAVGDVLPANPGTALDRLAADTLALPGLAEQVADGNPSGDDLPEDNVVLAAIAAGQELAGQLGESASTAAAWVWHVPMWWAPALVKLWPKLDDGERTEVRSKAAAASSTVMTLAGTAATGQVLLFVPALLAAIAAVNEFYLLIRRLEQRH